MKKILFIILFITSAYSQIATVNLIDATYECKKNEVSLTYDIDIAPGGGVWIEWYYMGGWAIIPESIAFTQNTGLNQYDFNFSSYWDSILLFNPYDTMFRMVYVDIETETYIIIDTFYLTCDYTFSINDVAYTKEWFIEDFNILGAKSNTEYGLKIKVYMIDNKSYVEKLWIKR